MENFLSAFSNANTTISSSNVDIKVSPEFHGYFEIKKGLLSMQINFYARVYESKYENIISLDDAFDKFTKFNPNIILFIEPVVCPDIV